MELLTKELQARFEEVGSQENKKNPLVIAKFFYPGGAGTWYATEYDPENRIFFGFASLFGDHNDEWGYFSLDELSGVKGRFGLGIERDMFFIETKAGNIPQIKLYLEEADLLASGAETVIHDLLDILEEDYHLYSSDERITQADDWLRWYNGEGTDEESHQTCRKLTNQDYR